MKANKIAGLAGCVPKKYEVKYSKVNHALYSIRVFSPAQKKMDDEAAAEEQEAMSEAVTTKYDAPLRRRNPRRIEVRLTVWHGPSLESVRSVRSFVAHHLLFCCAPFVVLVRTICCSGAHHLLLWCWSKIKFPRSADAPLFELCGIFRFSANETKTDILRKIIIIPSLSNRKDTL